MLPIAFLTPNMVCPKSNDLQQRRQVRQRPALVRESTYQTRRGAADGTRRPEAGQKNDLSLDPWSGSRIAPQYRSDVSCLIIAYAITTPSSSTAVEVTQQRDSCWKSYQHLEAEVRLGAPSARSNAHAPPFPKARALWGWIWSATDNIGPVKTRRISFIPDPAPAQPPPTRFSNQVSCWNG